MTDYIYLVRGSTLDDLDLLAGALDALLPGSKTMVTDVHEVSTNDARVLDILDVLFGEKKASKRPVSNNQETITIQPTEPKNWEMSPEEKESIPERKYALLTVDEVMGTPIAREMRRKKANNNGKVKTGWTITASAIGPEVGSVLSTQAMNRRLEEKSFVPGTRLSHPKKGNFSIDENHKLKREAQA